MDPSVRTPRLSSRESTVEDTLPLFWEATADEQDFMSRSSTSYNLHADRSMELLNVRKFRYQALSVLGLLTFMGVSTMIYMMHNPNPHSSHDSAAETRLNDAEYTPATTHCGKYDGIDHPYAQKCCAPSCGNRCGAKNCYKTPHRYGGSNACCSSFINKYCSFTGKAPCMLGAMLPADECKGFGGLLHPEKKKCCGAKCGSLCGDNDCWRGDGGVKACCKATTGLPKCSSTSGVPCVLVMHSNLFEGVLMLATNDVDAFVGNARSRIAVHDTLATLLHLEADQVSITGISSGAAIAGPAAQEQCRRRSFCHRQKSAGDGSFATAGYKITAPTVRSDISAATIAALSLNIPAALNYELSSHGMMASVTRATMPAPSVIGKDNIPLLTTVTTTTVTTLATTTAAQSTTTTSSTPLKIVLKMFTGQVHLTVDDTTEFLRNKGTKKACIFAIAKANSVDTGKVMITGLYMKAADEVSVGYQLVLPSDTPKTSEKLAEHLVAIRLRKAMTNYLSEGKVKVTIRALILPEPSVTMTEAAAWTNKPLVTVKTTTTWAS